MNLRNLIDNIKSKDSKQHKEPATNASGGAAGTNDKSGKS